MNFWRGWSKFSLKSVQALREVRDPVWIITSSSYSWLVKKGRLYTTWGNMFPCLRREIRMLNQSHCLRYDHLILVKADSRGGDTSISIQPWVLLEKKPFVLSWGCVLAAGGGQVVHRCFLFDPHGWACRQGFFSVVQCRWTIFTEEIIALVLAWPTPSFTSLTWPL